MPRVYRRTIIGVPSRDYVWVMARDPVLPPGELDRLIERVEELGYAVDELRVIPQRPLAERGD